MCWTLPSGLHVEKLKPNVNKKAQTVHGRLGSTLSPAMRRIYYEYCATTECQGLQYTVAGRQIAGRNFLLRISCFQSWNQTGEPALVLQALLTRVAHCNLHQHDGIAHSVPQGTLWRCLMIEPNLPSLLVVSNAHLGMPRCTLGMPSKALNQSQDQKQRRLALARRSECSGYDVATGCNRGECCPHNRPGSSCLHFRSAGRYMR